MTPKRKKCDGYVARYSYLLLRAPNVNVLYLSRKCIIYYYIKLTMYNREQRGIAQRRLLGDRRLCVRIPLAPRCLCAVQRFFLRCSWCIQPSIFGSCSPGCLHASLGSLLGGCVQQVYHLAPGVVRLIKDPTPDYHLVYK